jgi:hypothetical protein
MAGVICTNDTMGYGGLNMAWELKTVDDVEWQQDDSGVIVYINWVGITRPEATENEVRLDIMQHGEPLVSFQGIADNVRKAAMRWLQETIGAGDYESGISLERAAYIGAEIARAEIMKTEYEQD